MRKVAFLLIAALLAAPPKKDEYKDQLKAHYDNKYFLVLRDGLAVGACEQWSKYSSGSSRSLPKIIVQISGDVVNFETPGKYSFAMIDCDTVAPMPIHKGQLLVVKGVRYERPELRLSVETVSLHVRDQGAIGSRYEDRNRGAAELRFKLIDPGNYGSTVRQVESWLKVFSSLDEVGDYKSAGL